MRFGMDFGGTNLKAGVFDEQGNALVFREDPLAKFTAKGTLLDNLLNHTCDLTRGHAIQAGGLAIKGMVDTARGVVEEDIGAGSLLAGLELRAAFSETLGIPFAVENDARAYALGEWLFGAGQGSRALVCMTLGTGLGCAVIVEGRPYYGADDLGGLLGGHLTIDRNGPPCPCGNRGCLELYCSGTALHQRVEQAHGDLVNARRDALADFFDRVGRGDARLTDTFRAILEDLALGVVNVIHAYGPDVVVLGGGVMKSAGVILPPLSELVHRMAWTVPRGTVQIRPAQLGNRAAAAGVAFHPTLRSN